MSRRTEIGILVALFLVLGFVLYRNLRPDAGADADAPVEIALKPLKVPNPALHLNQLARIRNLVYTGNHRNIFSSTPPPPPPPKDAQERKDAAPVAPAGPPLPPPLQIPLKFYGMAVDPKTGNKLAFFTNGDNVYVAAPGQTLLGHFRLLSIGASTVRIEDTSTEQTGTLAMTLLPYDSAASTPGAQTPQQPQRPPTPRPFRPFRPFPMAHPPGRSGVMRSGPEILRQYRRPQFP